ncbi:MAG: YjbH domain-containing protein [Yoonia sp.]|uniref:YjbH domain-containing protein n=1 Tax=Yoonia sp. TaxID=2212373 RepID=UPI003EF873C3
MTPYFTYTLFDPDLPVRVDVGPDLNLSYAPRPRLGFNGTLRYPLYSSIDDATRTSDSILPRVRSEGFRYAIESDLEMNQLTAEYLYRPGQELLVRVTAGYLEPMFAGVSSELLWYPIGSKLALGAELNYAIQRDFDMLFGLRDYDVFTGHASAYYELGSGYHAQVDVGRYLAGDWGATFAL